MHHINSHFTLHFITMKCVYLFRNTALPPAVPSLTQWNNIDIVVVHRVASHHPSSLRPSLIRRACSSTIPWWHRRQHLTLIMALLHRRNVNWKRYVTVFSNRSFSISLPHFVRSAGALLRLEIWEF